MSWYHLGRDGLILQIQAQPGAKRTEVVGIYGDFIKMRLASPPVDGKANACMIEFLARRLGVKRSQVIIERGAGSRRKKVLVAVSGLEPKALLEKTAEG